MLRSMSCAAVIVWASCAFAQQDPEATRILSNAREAILKLENLSYKCTASTKGGLFDGMMPVFEAEVWQFKSEGNWHLRLKGNAEVPQKGKTEFLVVDDATVRFKTWVDDAKKMVYYRPSSMAKRARSEALNMSEYSWLKDLVDPDPLARELAAANATPEGTTELDGIPCDIVLVDHGESRGQSRWFFGAADHLPRKVERITAGQGLEFRTIMELSEFNADAGLVKESFIIATPEGYTREEPPVIDPEAGLITRIDPNTGQMVTEGGDIGAPEMPHIVIGLEPGNTAPDVKLTSSTGDEITSAAMRGNVFILGFWSSTALPCKRATPEIQKLHTNYADKRVKVVIATCKEKTPEAGSKFLESQGATYQIAVEADATAEAYKADVLPTFYIIGYRGEIIHKEVGYKAGVGGTYEMLEGQIDAYLASSGG